MRLPTMAHNLQHDCKHSTFDFTSQLQFDAGSNLFRSRSDTSIRSINCTNRSSSYSYQSTIIDQWEIPAIDFSLHPYRPTKLKSKKGRRVDNETCYEQFAKIPVPKVLEKPNDKGTPFVTAFRIHSAGMVKRLCVKDETYSGGSYQPLGPHAFRGDDFRPSPVEKLRGKPRFMTRFATDPGNFELKIKTISAINESTVQNDSSTLKRGPQKAYDLKTFVTSTKQKPKWQRSLVLPKEKYRRISGDHIRMNQIVKQLSWSLENEKTPALDRPDIKDYKTIDWLQVTSHSKK